MTKKDELSIYNNAIPNYSRSEYPIYLYTKASGALRDYLLFKKINEHYIEDQLQSWVWCLHKSLTDITIRTQRMKLVRDNTVVYSGICIDNYALSEEFQKGRKLYFGKFLSTSIDRNVAETFACDNGFLFIITIKNNERSNYCYKINQFSQFKQEEEILITAFALFQITNIVKRNNKYEIYLDCLGFGH